MLTELQSEKKSVGLKQSRKAIKEGSARRVFVALDADERVRVPVAELCREAGVELTEVPTMAELGRACGINVGAAVAALLK